MRVAVSQPPKWQKYRGAMIVAAIVLGVGLWVLFRPEALFINRQVSERAPAAVAELQPLFTGSLHAVGSASQTTGRVNILKSNKGLLMEVANLESSVGGSLAIAMGASETRLTAVGNVTVGGHDKLPLPPGLGPDQNRFIVLMDSTRQVVAKTTLEPF